MSDGRARWPPPGQRAVPVRRRGSREMTGGDVHAFSGATPDPVGPPQRVATRGWGSHRTIGAAIRAAAAGGVVAISPGVYPESLVTDRNVTIVADTDGDGTVELVPAQGAALLVRSGTTTVQGLSIRGQHPDSAVVSISGGALALHDCDISVGRLTVAGWASVEAVGCRIHHGGGPAVEASGDSRIGLSGCVIEDVEGTGVALAQSTSAEVIGGVISRVSGAGMQLSEASAAKVVDCEVAETGGAGAVVADTASLILRGCRLRDLTGDGIRVENSSERPAKVPDTSDESDEADEADDPRICGGVLVSDCAITRVGSNALYTAGGAHVVARRCQIQNPGRTGSLSTGESRLDLVGCELRQTASTGLVAQDTAKLSAIRCSVAEAGGNGAFITNDAAVRLADCTISASALTAVHIGGTATVDMLRCQINGTPEHGVRVTERSMLRWTGGSIGSAGMTALRIEDASDATVRKVTIAEAAVGIRVQDSPHRPLIEECEVTGTGKSALEAGPSTAPIVRECTFRNSSGAGLFLDHDSRAIIDRCEITDVAGSGVVIWTAAAMPARNRACPTAASIAVRCTVLNACLTCPISSRPGFGNGTSSSTPTASPALSLLTTCGRRTLASSIAASRNLPSSRTMPRPIQIEAKTDTRMANKPRLPARYSRRSTGFATCRPYAARA
jgi:hypothetical protein